MSAPHSVPPPKVLGDPTEQTPPRQLLGGLWIVWLVLSLLAANDLRAWVLADEWLGTQPWALAAVQASAHVAHAAGLSSIGEGLRHWSEHWLPTPSRPRPTQDTPESTPSDTSPEERDSHGRDDTDEALAAAALPNPVPFARSLHRRILLVGASSMQFYLGSELEHELQVSYSGVELMRVGKVSTGLARPDVLDWPQQLERLVGEFHPDIVIGNFGGNDAQNMLLPDGRVLSYGTLGWDEEYRKRVERITVTVQKAGGQMVLIGMPPMRSPSFSLKMQHLNDLTIDAVTKHHGLYLSTWDLAGNGRGHYVKAVTVDGVRGLARLADGQHYSRLGARQVVRGLLPSLEHAFTLVPRDEDQALYLSREIASIALGREVSYGAYIPQRAGARGEGLPVLFLLNGSDGGVDGWPSHAHRALQQLAGLHNILVVTPEGGENGWYVDSPQLPAERYASHLLNEVLLDCDVWLPTNGRRGIAGQATASHGALAIALKNPDLFRSASGMSALLDLPAAREELALVRALGPFAEHTALWNAWSPRQLITRDVAAAKRLALLISVGTDDPWVQTARTLDTELSKLGVTHVFREQAGGRNDWAQWITQLTEHVAFHAQVLGETPGLAARKQ
ncbi:MAG: DUF459 domain-containing protein [Polyangiales bacterium]